MDDRFEEIEQRIIDAVRQSVSPTRESVDMALVVAATSNIPLTKLDYLERVVRYEYDNLRYRPNDSGWKSWLNVSPAPVSWLDILSADGYRREAALGSIGGSPPNAFFFVVLLRRLNDWVPQVREAARALLTSEKTRAQTEVASESLCVILRVWASWQRMTESERSTFLNDFCDTRILDALLSRISKSPTGAMAAVLSELGRLSDIDDYLPKIAADAVQPAVRAKAFRWLLDGNATWSVGRKWGWIDLSLSKGKYMHVLDSRGLSGIHDLHELLVSSTYDRSASVRRVAGEYLIKNLNVLGARARPLAEQLARDDKSSVSFRGRFALERIE